MGNFGIAGVDWQQRITGDGLQRRRFERARRFGGQARSMTALESEGERRAYVTHPLGPQLSNPSAQAILGHRHHVV